MSSTDRKAKHLAAKDAGFECLLVWVHGERTADLLEAGGFLHPWNADSRDERAKALGRLVAALNTGNAFRDGEV